MSKLPEARTTLVRWLRSGECVETDGPASVCYHRERRKTKAVIRALPNVKIRVGPESACGEPEK